MERYNIYISDPRSKQRHVVIEDDKNSEKNILISFRIFVQKEYGGRGIQTNTTFSRKRGNTNELIAFVKYSPRTRKIKSGTLEEVYIGELRELQNRRGQLEREGIANASELEVVDLEERLKEGTRDLLTLLGLLS